MTVSIQIPDHVYWAMWNNKRRVKRSIGLTSSLDGNFNAHRIAGPVERGQYIKTPHGRVSVGRDQVRFSLHIKLDEADIVPSRAIESEAAQASDFVDRYMNHLNGHGHGVGVR